ncbi:MAG: MmgE/PrpD family protein [Deltaproteobacteria bacterium]|nr:MmgE/PrpD family protein [Deltaproteobacteria bacterium]
MKDLDLTISGATKKIATWVYDVKFEDIPERIIYKAKTQIMNIIAAIFAGYQTNPGKVVLQTVSEWGGKQECTIIPTGKKTTLRSAVYANSSLSMTLDYDDYIYPVHTGHSSAIVSLALTEKLNLSGKDLLLAQIIATEVEGRTGASVIMGAQNGQMCSFVHIIGSACAASKLMGLDEEKIENAIGIGMFQPNYGLLAGFMGSDAKILTAAIPATTGIEAAGLAANGLTGTRNILEDNKGFCKYFSFAPLMSMYTGFGKTWLTDTICYKPYPGCAYIDTLVDCILMLSKEHDINPDMVHRINIYANILTYIMDRYSKPFIKGPESNPVTLNFSVPYNAAVALIDKELTPRQFMNERIKDRQIWDLASKVRLYLNLPMSLKILSMPPISTKAILKEAGILKILPLLGQHLDLNNIPETIKSFFRLKSYTNLKGPKWRRPKIQRGPFDLGKIDLSDYKMPIGAIVEIIMKDGSNLVKSEEKPLGSSGYSKEENRKMVEEKFKREVGNRLGKDSTRRAIEIISKIEESDSERIGELIKLLCS